MISVAMLGPVEVRRDGDRVSVPAGKTTEVLMYLALAAGSAVRTELLFEDVWGPEAVGVGRNALQSKVSQLRKSLGDPGLVVGTAAGYTLAVDAGAVDALEVLRLADEAAALAQSGDPTACMSACSRALALFRGEGLFDASDAEWLAPHRSRLEAVRSQLIEHQLGARMDLGAAGELVGELEALTAAHPLREGLWALLMTALYRDGRQADALAAYRRVRDALAEELGLDPGPDLQRLEQQILDQDPGLGAPDRGRREPVTSIGNLPPISSTMVGRDRELGEIGDRISGHRLVTVVGPAGVGKTRLALEVASAAAPRDGAWLVRLEDAPTAETVIETIAAALLATGTTTAALTERLRGADVLVVLDNCEHVVDAVVDVVDPLLSAGPGVRILATSQRPLGVDGERVYGLEPLTMEESLALFTHRAGEHGRALATDEGRGTTLEEVCRSLDGLPLAIELAAARTKSLSLAEIARRLDDRFVLLTDPTSRKPERRRGLSAAIGWSYDLLFPDDQRGLWALACFVGGAPLSAAEQVLLALGVPEEAAVDVVSRLVDRSLVAYDTAADGTMRYRLLDSVRTFAMDRLEEAGQANDASRAHAGWVASAVADAAVGAKGPEQARHVAFARTERFNIDAALAWAGEHDPALAAAIADDLGWAWVVLGDAGGAQRLRTALRAADALVTPERRVSALLSCAWLEASAGDVDRGRAAIDEAFACLGSDGDDYLRAKAEWYSAYVLAQRGLPEESLTALARARPTLRELGRGWDEAGCWVLAAHCHIALGDPAAARDACAEAIRLLDRVGDPWLQIHVEAILGAADQGEHRFADACGHLAQAAAQAGQLGFAASEAFHLANLGRAQQQAGDLRAAGGTLRRAIEVARATGALRIAALARMRLSRVLVAEGSTEAARATLQDAHTWYHESGGGFGSLLADCLLAAMEARAGHFDATTRLDAVLVAARAARDTEVEVLALDALARLRACEGAGVAATELLALADDRMSATRHHLIDADRTDAAEARRLLGG